jgi:hypothetical protein
VAPLGHHCVVFVLDATPGYGAPNSLNRRALGHHYNRGLSLKVGQGLRQKASDAVKRVLDKLSPEGVKKILSMSQGSYWAKGNEYDGRNENSELVKLGLVDEVPANELDQKNGLEHKNFGYGIRPTQLGRETQSFLQSVVSEFVQQLGYAAQGEPDKK